MPLGQHITPNRNRQGFGMFDQGGGGPMRPQVAGGGQRLILGDQAADRGQHIADIFGKPRGGVGGAISFMTAPAD